jgi:hypothetical protein
MPRFPFFERVNVADHVKQLTLGSYTPEVKLEGLLTGVDNLRHDVYLSPKFSEIARGYLLKVIAKYGAVEDLVQGDLLKIAQQPNGATWIRQKQETKSKPTDTGAEFKRALAELQLASLNQAKSQANISIDVLCRLAVIKFLRLELAAQFTQVLERCRTKLKEYEGPRSNQRGLALRDRFLKLQVSKKIILRKAGQELFATMREIEKESLARMRRSLFGDVELPVYDLFMDRLLFTEDGRDDYLNGEHYVMLGNYDRDTDRFQFILETAEQFLEKIGMMEGGDPDELRARVDGWLSSPENAQLLVAGGSPDENSSIGRGQRALLAAWTQSLEDSGVMPHVIASYEVVPLLGEYTPIINPQQLKNALISRTERKRVEKLLDEHGKISTEKLQSAVRRLESYSSNDRTKVAGRFLVDFMRYHRDLRRLEAVNGALVSINVITNEKLRELSAINSTLYEFLLLEEQKPAEDKVNCHVVLKADIRDSTYLTRTLFERGLNPASYFSLNFYEPVNKLLPKYGASKVFIEGDAVILAMFERENEQSFVVARTCMMAREMIGIVRGYNEQSQKAGLPILELGIGICFQDSAPMYLVDGSSRIMISKALNESDRLSSCSKAARKYAGLNENLFNVFAFKTVEDADTGGTPEEFLIRYNIGGVHINEHAFTKLQQEIKLQLHEVELPGLWGKEKTTLYSGLVPVATNAGGTASFHRIVVRDARIPHINAVDMSLREWTDRPYYEVCTNAAVYDLLDAKSSRAMATR